MKKLEFKISINADREKVWDALWADANYRRWTSIFSETSHAKSDWKEGSEILFLDKDENGMYSLIEKLDKPSEMKFKHLGELKKGEKLKGDWSEAIEQYQLFDEDGKTDLLISVDSNEEFADFFEKTFPNSLQIVKEISES
ncbi:hypothetical protein A5893_07470 [Pedobacter psychrophilus]|uniref:Activator of Hsp90 ATPase homologue 1/2-like C-terminal domain-containing protein n=1 Tax=Pedobacter psychrophilus TaxID=1826909 RepID=A0A179DJS9_9SPHI|nr:SRPBCC domain-containing protein [Pedobacter psychrophilus]OAQ40769.1 hypothetical protein A5893_07470 [Pedobacter psychrophilus]